MLGNVEVADSEGIQLPQFQLPERQTATASSVVRRTRSTLGLELQVGRQKRVAIYASFQEKDSHN